MSKWKMLWKLLVDPPIHTAHVKISITCECGAFIPGLFRPGRGVPSRYTCARCNFEVLLQDHYGPIDW